MCTIGILGQSHRRCALVTNGEHAGVIFRSLRTELPWPVILYCLKNTFTNLPGRSSSLPVEEDHNQLPLLAAPVVVQDIDLPVLRWASRL